MDRSRVLIVDDDGETAERLVGLVREIGFEPVRAAGVREALQIVAERRVASVLVEWGLPEAGGRTLLTTVARSWPGLPVVVVARRGSIAGAVAAMRAGAADYLYHPIGRADLGESLARLAARSDSTPPPEGAAHRSRDRRLVGASPEFMACVERIHKAARSTTTVLLRGESGTGKELAAREIHRRSDRGAAPFVKVHCAALPDTLLESELFGYERGAFSGADARKLGRVDLARGGTLFLDEVGDVKPAMQVKLLSLLQDREYERLGGTATLHADVRFIAATNRDLESMVARGRLREDLFYRLNVLPLWLPPLRDRGADAALLARHFLTLLGEQSGRGGLTFEPGALELFERPSWPGNVRQLQNVVERLLVLSDGSTIRRAEVEAELAQLADGPRPSSAGEPPSSAPPPLERQRLAAERDALLEALQACRYNRTRAARMLGVSRRTLYNRLRAHGLHVATSARK